MFKRLILTVAAVALTASGALAEPQPKKKTKVQQPESVATTYRTEAAPESKYRNDPNAVFYGGTYIGSDPDPGVRAQMLREAPWGTGSTN